jgi:hypothetical protein
MKKILLSFFILLIFTSCASKIMQTYIGKDIRSVVIDYGPPANAFDMGNGVRVFQWINQTSYTTPQYITTHSYIYGNSNTYGKGGYSSSYMSGWINSNTQITGGQTINSTCIYTFFTKWNKIKKAWIVTGFKQPSLMCE